MSSSTSAMRAEDVLLYRALTTPLLRAPVTHRGSIYRYRKGCRCTACKEAWSQAARRYRARKLDRGLCQACAQPTSSTSKRFCPVHQVQHNTQVRNWYRRRAAALDTANRGRAE